MVTLIIRDRYAGKLFRLLDSINSLKKKYSGSVSPLIIVYTITSVLFAYAFLNVGSKFYMSMRNFYW